jgi:uncharacterized protein (UPF0333 family)
MASFVHSGQISLRYSMSLLAVVGIAVAVMMVPRVPIGQRR